MDKCREEFEQSPKTKELLSDSIYFDEKENRYKVNADGCLISVVFLSGRWEVWQEQQAKVEEANAKAQMCRDEKNHAINRWSAVCKERDELQEEFAEDERFLKEQIKDKDLKISNLEYLQVMDKELIQSLQSKSEKLQKRVQFLEQELGAWKGKSIAAMINGMCGQCGKEPLQAIVSDREGYALLHCFGCGANKYELIGEQALKGGCDEAN
ncbi:hypothetical protein RBI65_16035 [Acinetobacter baumannii]|uniref:hypothetical protein n=1 Tax=Acinetobacter baumannii TaxID=470 RepID=UPI0027BB8568|nr:hypothetical protein [Acinetobacter baumannii]MDQ2466060.1 hypothetical protein [Acinetobacter baumannii]